MTQTGVMKRVWALQAIQDAVKAVKTMKELDIEAKVSKRLMVSWIRMS